MQVGKVYSGWGSVIDPAIPAVVRTYGMASLIRPMPETGKTLNLGGDIPPAYSLPSKFPQFTLFDDAAGTRLWTKTLPVTLPLNHGALTHWGTNGVALRATSYYARDAAPAIFLFRFPM